MSHCSSRFLQGHLPLMSSHLRCCAVFKHTPYCLNMELLLHTCALLSDASQQASQ